MQLTRGNAGLAARPVLFVLPGLEPGAVQVAESLAAAGLLRMILTPLAVAERAWTRHLPQSMRRRLSTRVLPATLAGRVQYFPIPELLRVLTSKLPLSDTHRDRIWYWAESSFDRYAARVWAGRVPFIYGCEHASVETFVRQKRRGGKTILWQVIAHPRFLHRVISDELDRFPEMVTPFMRLWRNNLERSRARKEEQFAHTDLVVANSPFVRDTFVEAGFAPERVVCVPTGCPAVMAATAVTLPNLSGPPVFINAGGLTVRKGIHLLLDAWKRLRPGAGARLVLHGEMQLPSAYRSILSGVEVGGRLPRPDLHALFQRSTLFVLPTLAEGRANVVLEALANGLPVLTTPNSGCTDVVIEGRTGFLVPAGNVDALAERLSWCLDHPQDLAAMRDECLKVARAWQFKDFARQHAACIARYVSCYSR
jgi:glycosyltransferase involved in cell wall biosynthesis